MKRYSKKEWHILRNVKFAREMSTYGYVYPAGILGLATVAAQNEDDHELRMWDLSDGILWLSYGKDDFQGCWTPSNPIALYAYYVAITVAGAWSVERFLKKRADLMRRFPETHFAKVENLVKFAKKRYIVE